MHVLRERDVAALTARLVDVEGGVGVAPRLLQPRWFGLMRRSRWWRRWSGCGRPREGWSQGFEQAFHRPLGGRLLLEIFEEDAELVTAQPRCGVAGSYRGREPAGHLEGQLVANPVAKTVVDVLEVVEVEHQHPIAARAPSQALVGVLDAVAEEGSVWQAGERVAESLMLELALHSQPLSDVTVTAS